MILRLRSEIIFDIRYNIVDYYFFFFDYKNISSKIIYLLFYL